LPSDQKNKGHALRKPFVNLPPNIQELVITMVSTVPERRSEGSLKKCIAIFDGHLTDIQTRSKLRTLRPSRISDDVTKIISHKSASEPLPEPETESGPEAESEEFVFELAFRQKLLSIRQTGMLVMFGILILFFSQYIFFFDGQKKINDIMPYVYEQVSNSVSGIFGGRNVQ